MPGLLGHRAHGSRPTHAAGTSSTSSTSSTPSSRERFVMENVKALAASPRWAPIRDRLLARAARAGLPARPLRAQRHATMACRKRASGCSSSGSATSSLQQPIPTTTDRPPTVREALSRLPRVGEPGNDGACARARCSGSCPGDATRPRTAAACSSTALGGRCSSTGRPRRSRRPWAATRRRSSTRTSSSTAPSHGSWATTATCARAAAPQACA